VTAGGFKGFNQDNGKALWPYPDHFTWDSGGDMGPWSNEVRSFPGWLHDGHNILGSVQVSVQLVFGAAIPIKLLAQLQ
jgi:hypothetical protein